MFGVRSKMDIPYDYSQRHDPEQSKSQSSELETPQIPSHTPLSQHLANGQSQVKQYPQRSPSSIWRYIRSGYGPDYNSESSGSSRTSPPHETFHITSTENGKRPSSGDQDSAGFSETPSHPQSSTGPSHSPHHQSVFKEHLDEFSPPRPKSPVKRGLITGDGACGRRDIYYDGTLGEWRPIPPIHVDTELEVKDNEERSQEEGDETYSKASRMQKKKNRLNRAVDSVVDVFKGRDSEDKDGSPNSNNRSGDPVKKPIFGFDSIY